MFGKRGFGSLADGFAVSDEQHPGHGLRLDDLLPAV